MKFAELISKINVESSKGERLGSKIYKSIEKEHAFQAKKEKNIQCYINGRKRLVKKEDIKDVDRKGN